MKKYVIFLNLVLFNFFHLKADLDGTINPIWVNTHYTFTDGESATGFVYFKNGFDIPAGGTVSLGVVVPIEGTINFNGGTLRLTDNLDIRGVLDINGPGFIWTTDLRTINVNNAWFLQAGDDFTFIGFMIRILSNGSYLRFIGGTLNLAQLQRGAIFQGCRMTNIAPGDLNDNFIVPNSQLLDFVNCALFFENTEVTFFSPFVRFEGACHLMGQGNNTKLTIPNRSIVQTQGILLVDRGITFNVSEGVRWGGGTTTILRNSTLEFSHSLSTTIPINIEIDGNIITEGTSFLRSPNQLIFGSSMDLSFSPGGRLVLSEGTSLVIN